MKRRNLLWLFLAVLIFMQFFRIDTKNPVADGSLDFFAYSQADSTVVNLIKASCYDCHSNETKYPWYVQFAPVSWWLNNHIKGGRKHLNFSEWHNYSVDKKAHKLEECIENVEEKYMPLKSYTWMHSEAKLSDEERAALVNFFKTYMATLN
jgi:hypothetical protein